MGVLASMCDAEGSDAISDILGDLDADLKTENTNIRVERSKVYKEAAKAASDIGPLGRRGCRWEVS